MSTVSIWASMNNDAPEYPQLMGDFEVDVAVIGGGITGITTALHLINAGKKVAILEADRMGSGTTASSSGNLYVATQPYYQNIQKKFDAATVKTIAFSRQFAID